MHSSDSTWDCAPLRLTNCRDHIQRRDTFLVVLNDASLSYSRVTQYQDLKRLGNSNIGRVTFYWAGTSRCHLADAPGMRGQPYCYIWRCTERLRWFADWISPIVGWGSSTERLPTASGEFSHMCFFAQYAECNNKYNISVFIKHNIQLSIIVASRLCVF